MVFGVPTAVLALLGAWACLIVLYCDDRYLLTYKCKPQCHIAIYGDAGLALVGTSIGV